MKPVLNTLKYRPDIDGLRAIAVLSVIFFHADLGFRGGFIGVDVFFVISGYLITGLILKDLEHDHFEILEFWSRRVRRILPTLLIVIICCLTAGWFFLFPADFKALGMSVIAQAFFSSNIYFWLKTGYFGKASELMPLLHTWSLAVEEQFYLFFPFLLITARDLSRLSLILLCSILGLLSFSLSIYGSYKYPDANFFLLPPRAWELLIGAIPAMIPRHELPQWLKEILAWAGLLAIFCAVFFYNHEMRFPGLSAFLPCVGSALVIFSNTGALTSVGKLLSLPPMVFFGLISYSLYLWHWPLLVFTKYMTINPLTAIERLSILAASILLAFISWKWVETPFRHRVFLKNRMQTFLFAGGTIVFLILTGFTLVHLQGLPARFSPQVLTYANASFDQGNRTGLSLKDVTQGNFIELGDKNLHLPPRLFIWGDSHAMATLSIMDTLCREHGVRGLAATHSSTTPLLGFESVDRYSLGADSIPYNDQIMKFIKKEHFHDVVVVAAWGYINKNCPKTMARRCLDETINELKASNVNVWIMLQVPEPSLNVPHALAQYAILGGRDSDGPFFPMNVYHDNLKIEDQLFHGISSSGVTILDPSPLFFDSKNRLIVKENGKPLYFDDHHLSVAGASKLRPLFEPIFDDMDKSIPLSKK